MAASACQWFGVAIETASMSLLSMIWRRSLYSSSCRGRSAAWASSVGRVEGWVAAEAERLPRGCRPSNRSFSLLSTSTSQSHSPTSRTPFILLKASVWLLPRPFRPIVAMRMSPFAPTTAAQDLAVQGTLTAAAATSEPFNMLRRESDLLIVRDPVR